jgi:hypothetical protein
LPEWVDVAVHVMRSDKSPAAGAMVSIPRSTVPVPELALIADSAGTAKLRLPPGRFTIEAFTEDGGKGSVEIAVEGAKPMEVDLRIEGDGR